MRSVVGVESVLIDISSGVSSVAVDEYYCSVCELYAVTGITVIKPVVILPSHKRRRHL